MSPTSRCDESNESSHQQEIPSKTFSIFVQSIRFDLTGSTYHSTSHNALPLHIPHTMEEYEWKEQLGEGTFGICFRAIHKRTGTEVAIKQMKETYLQWEEAAALREFQGLLQLSSSDESNQLVRIFEIHCQRQQQEKQEQLHGNLYFVLEYMTHGTLQEWIKRRKRAWKRILEEQQPAAPPQQALSIKREDNGRDDPMIMMYDILQALSYIHSKGYIHRDVKPENILLYHDHGGGCCRCKLTDFSLTRQCGSATAASTIFPESGDGDKKKKHNLDQDNHVMTTYVSTRWYRAPELLLGATSYDTAVDLFAFGCVWCEAYALVPLFPGTSETDQWSRVSTFLDCSISGMNTMWPEGVALMQKRGLELPKAMGGAATQNTAEAVTKTTLQGYFQMHHDQRTQQQGMEQQLPNHHDLFPQNALATLASVLSLNPVHRPTATSLMKEECFAPIVAAWNEQKKTTAIKQDSDKNDNKENQQDLRVISSSVATTALQSQHDSTMISPPVPTKEDFSTVDCLKGKKEEHGSSFLVHSPAVAKKAAHATTPLDSEITSGSRWVSVSPKKLKEDDVGTPWSDRPVLGRQSSSPLSSQPTMSSTVALAEPRTNRNSKRRSQQHVHSQQRYEEEDQQQQEQQNVLFVKSTATVESRHQLYSNSRKRTPADAFLS